MVMVCFVELVVLGVGFERLAVLLSRVYSLCQFEVVPRALSTES